MRKRLIAIVVTAAFLTGLAGSAAHGAASWCEIQEKLGVRNVKECENPTS